MKRYLILTLVCIMALTLLCGCGNKKIFDTTYKFDYAIIELPNGNIVEGKVKSWKDYEGEQLQVVIGDTTYLVNSNNIVMTAEK